MKISAVDIISLPAQRTQAQTPVLVRVWTDENLYGYGEAGISIQHASLGCVEILRQFSQPLLGQDPLAHDVISDRLQRQFWARTGGPVLMAALSALDTALWDIKGKYYNAPVSQLLGGRYRDQLRCYASQLQNGWENPRFLQTPADLTTLRDACLKACAQGYSCIKVDVLSRHLDGSPIPAEETAYHLSLRTLKEAEQKLTVIRDSVGPDCELIIENHCLTRAQTAIQLARLAKDYDPILLEEPANPLDLSDYQRIRAAVDIPLATGERSYTRRGFLPLLQAGVLDTVQPDLGNCGGITEGRKIADLADTYSVSVQTHTCNTPISVACALQFEAAIPNFIFHEHHTCNTLPAVRALCLYDDQPVNGYIQVPQRPGIGNELSPQALAQAQIIHVGPRHEGI
ncbi:mandelate racemase/muconate lactonizing enzyme family protein [Oscillospiraceae bacterium HV4-5-C5C]|nr:mandelate racemase/muconate lactonizing enzyme family protein [Oscillospiraceae bacterium HV4-5-C5C]